jgi:hypothetical protein
MFVGEIGGNREAFLYTLKWWEIRSIIRGYLHRYRHMWEMARLCAYTSAHCMGSKTTPPPPDKWLPFHWERKRGSNEAQPTPEEIERLRQLIIEENEKHGH